MAENASSVPKVSSLMPPLPSAVPLVATMKSTTLFLIVVIVPETPSTSAEPALPALATPLMTLYQRNAGALTASLNVETSVSPAAESMRSFPTENAAALLATTQSRVSVLNASGTRSTTKDLVSAVFLVTLTASSISAPESAYACLSTSNFQTGYARNAPLTLHSITSLKSVSVTMDSSSLWDCACVTATPMNSMSMESVSAKEATI